MVFKTVDYHIKMAALLSDNNTYASSYKKKFIGCLQQLAKEKAIDHPYTDFQIYTKRERHSDLSSAELPQSLTRLQNISIPS